MAHRTCSVEGCSQSVHARGWCGAHYARWLRNGSPALQARPTLAERFWAKVDRSGGPDACWPWTGATNGRYGLVGGRDGKMAYAHRVAWVLAHGLVPDGLFVLHHCDNPPCCNPGHLFLGTNADNVADMMAKGRHRALAGDAHPRRKLTDEDVRAIRNAWAAGTAANEIATRFGVTDGHVRRIARRTRR